MGKIGVVTVTYNSAAVLPDFLASLDSQSYRNFAVYAVDSASSDTSVAMLQKRSSEQFKIILNQENVGIAKGNNQGIQAALADGCSNVLLLNNDVAFGPDLFLQLVEGMNEHSCTMTVPLIYFHDSPQKIWAAGGGFQPLLCYRSYHRGEGKDDRGQYNMATQVDFAPACCILIRREVFEKIGLIDERYFVYSEDVDFMYRAFRADLQTFFIPSAKLWHKVHSLTGGDVSDFTLFYGSRGRSLFLYKHFNRITAWAWTRLYLMFCSARVLLGKDTGYRSAIRRKGTREGQTARLTQFV